MTTGLGPVLLEQVDLSVTDELPWSEVEQAAFALWLEDAAPVDLYMLLRSARGHWRLQRRRSSLSESYSTGSHPALPAVTKPED